MKKHFTLTLLALTALLFACHRASVKEHINGEPMADKSEMARWRWEAFKSSVNWDVAKEKRGEQPTAGHDTWRGYWIWGAGLVRKRSDGGRLHVQYIIEQRQKAGLPDIAELSE